MAAGDEVVIGLNEFIEQPSQQIVQAGEPTRLIRSWHGPQAILTAKINEVDSLAPDSREASTGVPGIITATWVQDPEPTGVQRWELLAQKLDKPLATHGKWQVSAAVAPLLEQIDAAVRKGTARNTDFNTTLGFLGLNKYRDYLLRGIHSYQDWAFIVRKTVQISNAANVDVEFSAIPGKVISWAELGVPVEARFKQPKGRRVQFPAVDPAVWEDFLFKEWMTDGPSITYQKGKKIWTIQQDYEGAEKWADFYEGGSYDPS